MKRRKKIWIACAALAFIVALCAMALLYPPPPFDFLRGARVDGVWTYQTEFVSESLSRPPTPTTTVVYETSSRRYWLPQTVAQVIEAAAGELDSEGWARGFDPRAEWYGKGIDDDIRISRAEGGGTYVEINSAANVIDRAQAWLRKFTHRAERGRG